MKQPVGGRHQRSGPDPATRPSQQPVVAADAPIRPAGSALSRVVAMLDAGSFVERYGHAGPAVAEPGGDDGGDPTVVVGTGTVNGRDVAIHALGPFPPGGTLTEAGAARIAWTQQLALRSRIPIVGVADWRDARQPDELAALARWSDVLGLHARSAGVVPQVAVVYGACASASPQAALSDLVIEVDGDPEEGRLGLAHVEAAGDGEARHWLLRLLAHLPGSAGDRVPVVSAAGPPAKADAELRWLGPDGAGPDVRSVVTCLLDGGELLEMHRAYAPGLVAGLGRLDGHAIGVVAARARDGGAGLDGDAADKAARLVRLCAAFGLPVLTVVDADGVADAGRGVGGGAELIAAYATATVPRLAVVTGAARGTGYLLLSPRLAGADLSLAWPRAAVGAPDPFAAAERGLIDAVVEPRQTRDELVRWLRLSRHRPAGGGSSGPSPG